MRRRKEGPFWPQTVVLTRLRTGQLKVPGTDKVMLSDCSLITAVFRVSAKSKVRGSFHQASVGVGARRISLGTKGPDRAVNEGHALCALAPARLEWSQYASIYHTKALYYRDTFSLRMIPYSHANILGTTGAFAFPRSHFSLQCIHQSQSH